MNWRIAEILTVICLGLICSCGFVLPIQADSSIDILVSNEPHLSGTFTVDADGFIEYHNLGFLIVKGRSSAEIERRIAGLITKNYPFLDKPEVRVTIQQDKTSSLPAASQVSYQTGQRVFSPSGESLDKELKPAYRISPHDQLSISVFGEKDLDKNVRVSEDGTINYPLIGVIYIKDLTVGEVIQKVEKLLEDNYFVRPQVSVLITEYSKFSVLGEVNRPGTFELKGALTVVDALVLAEGPKDSADLSKIKIIRTLRGETERVEEYTIDFDKEGRAFYLKPLDRVVVSIKGKIYVLGEVRNPGMYYITEKEISASDAVAFFANGITQKADTTAVEVIRKTELGDKVFTIDLETEGHAFILQEQDRITVKEYGSISVFGQVKKPGRYPYKKGLTVIDAIALAEGFTDVAAKNSVKVIRKQTSQEKAIRVPVGSILKSGDTSRDVELFDGDSIVVPESWF